MKDNLSIVISMIIFVILIVIFPLYNYFERQDDMSYNLALKTTTNFVDEVVESGYVDQDMYDRFVEELSNTGNVYDIQLEAHKKIKTTEDSGNTYDEQYLIDYNEQIFDTNGVITSNLNEKTIKDGSYTLDEGDQFYVKLKNSNTTMAGAIFNTIVPSSKKDRIVVNYGGIVKNEAWAKVDATYMDAGSLSSNGPKVELVKVGSTDKNKEIGSGNVIEVYPGNETFYFKASGSNVYNWWNKLKGYTWEVKYTDSSGDEQIDTKYVSPDDEFEYDKFNTADASYKITVKALDEVGNFSEETSFTINANEVIAGSTGGDQFDGENLDIDIPEFMNALPKKITLEVYLGSGHGAYTSDKITLCNGSQNIFDTTYNDLGSIYNSNNISVNVSKTTSNPSHDNLTTGNISFINIGYRLSKITIKFNYTNANSEDKNDFLKNLKLKYKNSCGERCYLNATDTLGVERQGVYNFKIEY